MVEFPDIRGKTVDSLVALSYQKTGTTSLVKVRGKKLGKSIHPDPTGEFTQIIVPVWEWEEVEREVADWDYLPCEWPEYGPDALRITFRDGSFINIHPQGYETDGVSVYLGSIGSKT